MMTDIVQLERRIQELERRIAITGIDATTQGWEGHKLVLGKLIVNSQSNHEQSVKFQFPTGGVVVAQVTLADDASVALETLLDSSAGVIILATSEVYGIVGLNGNNDTVGEISDPFAVIATADTDTNICFIPDGDGTYTLKNRRGAEYAFTLLFIGA